MAITIAKIYEGPGFSAGEGDCTQAAIYAVFGAEADAKEIVELLDRLQRQLLKIAEILETTPSTVELVYTYYDELFSRANFTWQPTLAAQFLNMYSRELGTRSASTFIVAHIDFIRARLRLEPDPPAPLNTNTDTVVAHVYHRSQSL